MYYNLTLLNIIIVKISASAIICNICILYSVSTLDGTRLYPETDGKSSAQKGNGNINPL